MTTSTTTSDAPRVGLRPLPRLIFASRWLQLPLYLGLIVAQVVYVILFLKELWHLVAHSFEATEQQIMLVVLGLIDVVMISNLLIMVIVGGYETFVSRMELNKHPDQPEWLSHVNASVLKIKLAMAIIGISSIHLLRTFIGKSGEPERHLHRSRHHVADDHPHGLHPFSDRHRPGGPHGHGQSGRPPQERTTLARQTIPPDHEGLLVVDGLVMPRAAPGSAARWPHPAAGRSPGSARRSRCAG
jgi:uncharacterized protein (TIGR00645 family)